MPSLRWAWGLAGVLYKTGRLLLLCLYKRITFLADPEARARDLRQVTETYDLPAEGLKYLEWRNARTVSNFFYTSHMVSDYFRTLLQDLNKSAGLHEAAPNPLLHEAGSGRPVRLLSAATPGLPLVINFGSCT